MNSNEFVSKLLDVLTKETLYVTGGIGQPLSSSTKTFFIENYSENKKREGNISKASSDTFAFDCSGLIKAIIWGWNGNTKTYLGGATYETNGMKDISTEDMIEECNNISTDFSNIEIGELLWIPGHVGICVDNVKMIAIECTPAWKGKVQLTSINQNSASYPKRNWIKHGRLKMIDYVKIVTDSYRVRNISIRYGVNGNETKLCQILLILNGYDVGSSGTDGRCGNNTVNAIKQFQKDKNLTVDGSCGKNTWAKLSEII